jgi:MYXO-CTERM domain-containing protein
MVVWLSAAVGWACVLPIGEGVLLPPVLPRVVSDGATRLVVDRRRAAELLRDGEPVPVEVVPMDDGLPEHDRWFTPPLVQGVAWRVRLHDGSLVPVDVGEPGPHLAVAAEVVRSRAVSDLTRGYCSFTEMRFELAFDGPAADVAVTELQYDLDLDFPAPIAEFRDGAARQHGSLVSEEHADWVRVRTWTPDGQLSLWSEPRRVCGCTSTGGFGWAWLAGLAGLVVRRRSRAR